jgi:hypothetical protein
MEPLPDKVTMPTYDDCLNYRDPLCRKINSKENSKQIALVISFLLFQGAMSHQAVSAA